MSIFKGFQKKHPKFEAINGKKSGSAFLIHAMGFLYSLKSIPILENLLEPIFLRRESITFLGRFKI